MYSHPLALIPERPLPVLLRKPSPARGKSGSQPAPEKLLVPVDGSAEAMHALEHVVARAVPGDTRVHLVNVQRPVMAGEVSYLMSAEWVADRRRAAGERALRAAGALLDASRIPYTSEVVFGNPADEIVRHAAERGCTKIVMGTRGRSLIGNLLPRAVASRVVRRAHVPVTLIKSPMRRAPAARQLAPA